MEADEENKTTVRGKDYDEALLISQEIGKQKIGAMTLLTPAGLELQIVSIFIAFIYPVVWAVVVFFYMTACVAGYHQSEAKKSLEAHDIDGAKTAFSKAKTWDTCMTITEFVMGCIQIWGFFKLVEFIKGG